MIAMHLVNAKKDGVEIPDVLPEVLKASAEFSEPSFWDVSGKGEDTPDRDVIKIEVVDCITGQRMTDPVYGSNCLHNSQRLEKSTILKNGNKCPICNKPCQVRYSDN